MDAPSSIIALVAVVLLVLGSLYACFRENGFCRSPPPAQTGTPVNVFFGARPIYDNSTDPEGQYINRIAKLVKFYHEGLVLQFNDPDTLKSAFGAAGNVHKDWTKSAPYLQWEDLIPTPFQPVLLTLELYSKNFLKSPLPDIIDGTIVPCEGYTVSRRSTPDEWQELLGVGDVTDLDRIRGVVNKSLNYAMITMNGAQRAASSPPLLYSLYNVYESGGSGEQLSYNCTCHTLAADALDFLDFKMPTLQNALHDSWDVFAKGGQDVGLKDAGALSYYDKLRKEASLLPDAPPTPQTAKPILEKLLSPQYVVGYAGSARLKRTCYELSGVERVQLLFNEDGVPKLVTSAPHRQGARPSGAPPT